MLAEKNTNEKEFAEIKVGDFDASGTR